MTSRHDSGILYRRAGTVQLLLSVCCFAVLSALPLTGQERSDPVQIDEAGVLKATGIDEIFDLSGFVRLLHGSTVLTSDRVRYDRMNGIVRLIGNVRMVREGSTLQADEATYYERDQRAVGTGRVRLNDETDGVVLTGDRMEYSHDPHRAVATGQPDMTWQQENSKITIEGRRLEYYFTESNTLLKALAEDSVVVVDDGEGVRITCDHVEYFKSTESARFTGAPRLLKRHESADSDIVVTGKGMTYTFGERTAEVFDSVRVVRGPLEGTCDTLRYDSEGQKIDLLSNPVIRSAFSEISGERIVLELVGGKVARAVVTGQATGSYAAGDVDESQRSTIEGRSMVVDFRGESVKSITASGNAVSTYNPSTLESGPSGHNVVRAKEIVIELDGGEPVKVSAEGGVDGTYLSPAGENGNR